MQFVGMLIVAMVALSGTSASGQSYFPNIQVSDFPDPVIDDLPEIDDYEGQNPSQMPGTEQALSLDFEVSQAVRQALIAKIVAQQRAVNPEGARELESLFASSDIIEQIDEIMRSVGLRSNNVADAYAVWWVAAWEAVNMKDTGSSAEMYHAVRQQAEAALLLTPDIAMASDALKQEFAESLLVQAAMIDAAVDAAAGDTVQQTAVSRQITTGALAMSADFDLTRMTLTERGFTSLESGE